MRYRRPADTVFRQQVLTVEQELCSLRPRALVIRDHRFHRIFTLQGPVEIVCKLARCPDPACPARRRTLSPLAEASITLPWWLVGWDVFCRMGHRRFARHWSVPQIRAEPRDSHRIPLSDDAISGSPRRHQTMVAARQQGPGLLAAACEGIGDLALAIDGLQPEKGHETLHVVRGPRGKRVWFAQALLSSAAGEVRGLVAEAREWAERLGKPVEPWMSDKQDAFVKAIAAEFPKTPRRYCQNHFLRDVAKPVLEADSHAKVKMREKARGLRAIEQGVLAERRGQARAAPEAEAEAEAEAAGDDAGDVVLAYRACVRGILNDGQGGPPHPPGLRMAEALGEVRESLQRNLDAEKGGPPRTAWRGWRAASAGAWRRSPTSRGRSGNTSGRWRGSRRPWTREAGPGRTGGRGSSGRGSVRGRAGTRRACGWRW